MPFRKNFFGDLIAQPGTEFAEIDQVMLDRHGLVGAEIGMADLFTAFDNDHKVGGEIFLFGQNIEAEEGEDDPIEASINFDNFGSVESAKAWLEKIGAATVNEVA